MQTESLEIDVTKISEKIDNQYLINLGFAGDLLEGVLADQLVLLKKLGTFTYGRVWGLTSETILPEYRGQYDFYQVDLIINRILKTGLKPFIELGIKGKILFETHTSILSKLPFVIKENKLSAIVDRNTALITHLVNQYGEAEVATWQIEIMRPNRIVLETTESLGLAQIEIDGKVANITKEEPFIKYFSILYRAIKKVVPRIKIGGCGLSLAIEKANIKSFFEKWQQSKVVPDFFSFSIFPMDELKNEFQNQKVQTPISPDPYYTLRRIKDIKQVCQQINATIPLYITEFNVTISNRDVINDTAFKGAYILKNCLEVSPLVKVIGYWLFSDASAVFLDAKASELFGGAGIVSKSGLPKIGYHAFDFLKQLGSEVLLINDELAITKQSATEFQVLASNYSHLNATYYYNSDTIFHQSNAYSMFAHGKEKLERICLKNLPIATGTFMIETYIIGRSSGNLLEELYLLSDNLPLSPTMVAYLQTKCQPELTVSKETYQHHEFQFEIELEPYDLVLMKLQIIK